MSVLDRHRLLALVEDEQLVPVEGSLTLDEGWAPYGQMQLTCALPDDLDLVDPRLSPRVLLRVTQSFGDGDPLSAYTAQLGGSVAAMTAAYGGSMAAITAAHHTPFNAFGVRASTSRTAELLIRDRTIDWARRRVTLSLETDEALLQDYALVSTTPYAPASTSVRSIVSEVLALIGAHLEAGAGDGTVEADASTWLPGVSAWKYLNPLVTAAALRLYCDEHRRWWLVDDTTTQPGQLTIVEAQNLTGDRDTIARRGEWYDAVVVTYEWTDELGARQRAWDVAPTDGTPFSKVLSLTYETPYPGAGAAARVLSRAVGRGRVQDVRAISDYSATPGQAVSVTVLDDDTQVGYVASVKWTFPGWEMDVTSRGLVEVPSTAWIFDPSGVAWNSIPVGIDWTEDI